MDKQTISTPVAIAIAAIALILIFGGGFWYMNRGSHTPPSTPTAAGAQEQADYAAKTAGSAATH